MRNNLKKNFILQVMYQVLTIITPLITAPYISRVLGATNVGINSYSFAIISYFVMVAELGIASYGSRLISQSRFDKKTLDKAFSELFVLHLLVSITVCIIYVFFWLFFVKEHKLVFALQGIYLFATIFDINWLFFGLEEFQKVVTKNSAIKILSVISILLLVKKQDDLPKYVAIIAVGILLNYIVLWLDLKQFVSFTEVTLRQSLKHFKPVFVLFLPAIAVMLYKYMDKIMLMNMKNSESVGYYDSGERIILLCISLINALGVVMLPRISNLKGTGDEDKIERYFSKSLLGIGFISIGCSFGAFSIAQDFIPLFFGKGYEPSIGVMKLLSVTLPFSAFANVIKTQYILPSSKDTFFAKTLILGAVLNFFINYLLIPKFGVIGASIGTICTEVFVCIVQMIASNKEMHTFKKMTINTGYVIAGFVMMLSLNLFDTITSVFVRIVVKVCVGAVVYILFSGLYLLIFNNMEAETLLSSFRPIIDKTIRKGSHK